MIFSHNICSGIKSQQVKKSICLSVPKMFGFFSEFLLPFHWVTFDHSISCVLLIDKPNESCQNSKKIERNAISITKKLLERYIITPVKANAPFSQTFSEGLKFPIQTYQMRKKELKLKLG